MKYEIALDPERSVVVEACAGSGKTWLLVSRILRLLLSGSEPAEILAITFTRRAAQEMEERLRDWLRDLALLPEDAAKRMLAERAVPEEELDWALSRARTLYEHCLVAPPMTITTFHGWFLEILQKAPLNSGLARANLVERVSPLIEEAWQSFAEELPGAERTGEALNGLFRDYGLENTRKLLLNFVQRRIEWWMYTGGAKDPVAFAVDKLQKELGVDPDCDPENELLSDGNFLALWREYCGYLEMSTEKDRALAAGENADFPALRKAFFTGDGKLRIRKESKAQAERLNGKEARFLELHRLLGERVGKAAEEIVHRKIVETNFRGFTAGAALLRHYQEIKERQGLVDFGDVEWRAHLLLHDPEHAAYLQYKLDSRYRHILLDEFQDTNPLQWQVLHAWFSAAAEVGSFPKIFMVGDPKQSIYRFRRAEARLFQVAADYLVSDLGAAKLAQNVSRRNSPAILSAVNQVFSAENFPAFHEHEAHHRDLAGRVEMLPLAGKIAREGRSGIRNPLIEPRVDEPDERVRLEAERFAQKISQLVGSYTIADGGQKRAAEYRDIMALVRKRRDLPEYERALRAAKIPYLGSSRGGLLETLEAGDLASLVSFLAVPFADLHLARVLKSPIFGVGDDELIALAEIGEGSWWARMQQVNDEGNLGRAKRLLAGWIESADRLPVHDLLDRIYFESDLIERYAMAVPEAMRARVGANLQSFLELALGLDAGRYPSLQRFVDELTSLRELDLEEAPDEGVIGDVGNAVRFYTVHSAKGLEAPIVFILGANPVRGATQKGFDVILDWPPEKEAPQHFSLYTLKEEQGAGRSRYFELEEQHAAREDLNLLYVAMTRASQLLFVSGIEGGAADSWYQKLAAVALDASEYPASGSAAEAAFPLPSGEEKIPPLPTGTRRPEPSEEQRLGIRLHFLLQNLAPPSAVELETLSLGEDDEKLLAEARAIMEAPPLRRFFDPGQYVRAWNELPYAGAGGEMKRIDRLVEFESEIWILDYKTGEAADPFRHKKQLEEYRNAMRRIFSEKPVRAAVVFKNGELAEI